MISEAIYLSLSLFISLSCAQLLSQLLSENPRIRKIIFILFLAISLTLFYRNNPKAFIAFTSIVTQAIIPSAYSATFLVSFLIFFVPFLIPLIILFGRSEVWLLAETVVRFFRSRPLRSFLNIITLFLVTSATISIIAIRPSTSIFEMSYTPSLQVRENIAILYYKNFKWVTVSLGEALGYVLEEENLNVPLDLRYDFIELLYTNSVCDFIFAKLQLKRGVYTLLFTNITFLVNELGLRLPVGHVLVSESIAHEVKIGEFIFIKAINSHLKVDGVFTDDALEPLIKMEIIEYTPDIIIDISCFSEVQFLNLYNLGQEKVVVVKPTLPYYKVRSNIIEFVLTNYYEESGRKPYVISPQVIFIERNYGYKIFTLGTYVFLQGDVGYLIITLVFIFLVIFSSLLSSIYERSKEYSIMSCVGASPRIIFIVLLLEGIYLASISSLLTLIFAYPLLNFAKTIGLGEELITGDILSSFILAVGTNYVGSILAFLAIRFRAIKKVTPSGVERIKVKRISKHEALVEVPIRLNIAEKEDFIKYLLEAEKIVRVLPGLSIHRVRRISENIVQMDVSYGIEREASYVVRLEVLERKINLRLRSFGPWSAEHTKYLNDVIRALRKFILSYRIYSRSPIRVQ